jgi:hypothetical protein
MKTRNALAVLLGVVAMALFAGQGAATAGTTDPFASYDQERFRVTIKGWQKMVQQNSHPGGEDDCDASDYSSGSERLFFRSTRPVLVRAIDLPGSRNPYLVTGRGRPVKLPTRASVRRSFTSRIGPTPTWCGGTGGGQTIPPDCGTRTLAPWKIGITYSYNRRDRVQASSAWMADEYRNCRGNAGAFPYLLDESGADRRPVFAEVPKREIFDGSIGKIITIARGHYRHRIPGYFYDTTVRWELTFERIRRG